MPLDLFNALLCLPGAIIFQAAGNVISDYFDFKFGVDRRESFGSSRMLVEGVIAPLSLLRYGMAILLAGIVLGLWLLKRSGIQLLWMGAAGVAGTFFYYVFKFRALGDLLIFIIFGQLIALGTAYAMTGRVLPEVLAVSAPAGLLIVNILHANNTRDILFDRKAGISTLAMLMGMKASKAEYVVLTAASYLAVAAMVLTGTLPMLCLMVFITLPLAVKNIKCITRARIEEPERIKGLDGMSAQLVMAFSVCMCVACLAAAWS